LNTLYNGFVFDDGFQIIENKWIRDPAYITDIFTTSAWGFKAGSDSNYYRPLMHIFFMVDYMLFGLKPWGFHLTNVIVHALNSILVFLIALFFLNHQKKISFEIPRALLAFATALIFAVHPVHSEVVAWISAIPEASFTFFFLIGLYTYMLFSAEEAEESGKRRRWLYIISLLAFLVSLFCKETALTLIGIVVAFDLSKNLKLRDLRIKRYIPYAAIIVGYMLLRVSVFSGLVHSAQHTYLTSGQYILNIFPLVKSYIWLILWPASLNAFTLFKPVLSLGEAKFLISLITVLPFTLLFILRYKNRTIFFSIIWAIFTLSPALYIPAVGATKATVFHDRYLYLSSAGFIMCFVFLLAWVITKLSPKRASLIFSIIIIVFSIILSAATIKRNRVWKDNYSLWSDTARMTTGSEIVYINLGSAADEKGLRVEALDAYKSALELNPKSAITHNNIGFLYFQVGEIEKSIESYKRASELATNVDHIARINENLGDAFMKRGNTAGATDAYIASIEASIDGTSADLYNKLGIAYGKQGQFDKAANSFKAALKINASHMGAAKNLEMINNLKR
jgi:hypothetical protein